MIAYAEVTSGTSKGWQPAIDRLGDLRPGLARIATSLQLHVASVFQTQGSLLGAPWIRLAPSTLTARAHRWGYYRAAPTANAGILTWTGGMSMSFRDGDPHHVRRISTDTLEFGSRLERARFHARGKRPILGFQNGEQLRRVVVQPFADWLFGRS